MDISGKEIRGINWQLRSEGASIDISDKPSGIYFVQIETNAGILHHKLKLVK